MKRKLEFEFDLQNSEDKEKLVALNVMAQALESPQRTKDFIQVANAIAQGQHISIQPRQVEQPVKAAGPRPVKDPTPAKAEVLPVPPDESKS
jgi:hypothetical protein